MIKKKLDNQNYDILFDLNPSIRNRPFILLLPFFFSFLY